MVGRIALGLVFVLALLGTAGRVSADTAAPPAGRRVAVDAKHKVTYRITPIMDGVIQFSGESPNVQFYKTSYRDGHFDLQIVSKGDSVYLSVNAFRIEATRGERTVTVGTNGAAPEELENARALLAGSRAVKQYRHLAAALEASSDNSAGSYSVLLGAGIVGALDGDLEAPARIARRLAAASVANRRATSGLRPVRMEDCWARYAEFINNAANDLYDCFVSAENAVWWARLGYAQACSVVFTIRAEGYWFEYLSCSAVQLRVA